MKQWKIIVLALLMSPAMLAVISGKPQQPKKLNILLICVDDLRTELKSFGKAYIHSPNIDRLAKNGLSFPRHFANAPSCGPSRYTLLTGQYGPAGNNALFIRSRNLKQNSLNIDPSMPEWFRSHGYTTVSVGKVSHHPGGRGGDDWNDSTLLEMPNAWDKHLMPSGKWKHPRGAMHGLANGEIRVNAADMGVFQTAPGDDTIYPDGGTVTEALNQIRELSADNNKPFFLAVGILKPHLPLGAPESYFNLYNNVTLPPINHPQKPERRTTWHNSNEFRSYNLWGKDPNVDTGFADEVRRHYAACVSYADAQVGKVMAELKRTGADKNTIVILWGDHGWHLGEHAIWGKHSLFEESLNSPLIIHYPGMKNKGLKSNAIVETLDIFPTLCELAGIEMPGFVKGRSLKNILANPEKKGHSAIAYTENAATIRTDRYRLILHKDGFTELYDHTSTYGETVNIASQYPDIVKQLKQELQLKLKQH